MKSLIATILMLTLLPSLGGVYGNLEFGDDRDTVTEKLQKSSLVDQTIDTTLIARTGLNGVFKCKAKLAGLTYQLYFDWDENGGLKEITLRSENIEKAKYSSTLYKAWAAAAKLFTQVYGEPAQNAGFPDKLDAAKHGIMMSHIWHKGDKQSILMGSAVKEEQCFLAIRFLNQHIEPVRIPAP